VYVPTPLLLLEIPLLLVQVNRGGGIDLPHLPAMRTGGQCM